jgi:hypothetical protein
MLRRRSPHPATLTPDGPARPSSLLLLPPPQHGPGSVVIPVQAQCAVRAVMPADAETVPHHPPAA